MKEQIVIDKELVKNIADSLVDEMATKMYQKLMLLKFLPEIKSIEKEKLKALKGKELDRFFTQLIKSK